jgi:hypothetical protein
MRELLIAYREHRLSKAPPPPPWSARAGWPDELLDALKSVKGAARSGPPISCVRCRKPSFDYRSFACGRADSGETFALSVDTESPNICHELGPRGGRTMSADHSGDWSNQAAMVAQIPLGRMGLPEDIGPVAVFLASDDARWITGDVIFASGGHR